MTGKAILRALGVGIVFGLILVPGPRLLAVVIGVLIALAGAQQATSQLHSEPKETVRS